MNTIKVETKSQLDELYRDDAFTIEGLLANDENLDDLAEWIKHLTAFKGEETAYIIEGGVMNREYNLTVTNAYPDTNCTIVCVKLSDLEKPMALMIPRFQVGGRWFSDVVDNNLGRELAKQGNGTEG